MLLTLRGGGHALQPCGGEPNATFANLLTANPTKKKKKGQNSKRAKKNVSAHGTHGEKPAAHLPWMHLGKWRVSVSQFVLPRILLQTDSTEPFLQHADTDGPALLG